MDILYNTSQAIHWDFPQEWDAVSIAAEGVDIDISTTDGTELLASAAMTLLTGRTITSAASPGDVSIVVSDTVSEGDIFVLVGDTNERIKVVGYDSGTGVASLAEPLYYAHDSGVALHPAFATYTLDATDTDTFVLGYKTLTSFTPGTDDPPARETGEILSQDFSVGPIEDDFRTIYPQLWSAQAGESFDDFYKICKRQVEARWRGKGLVLSKLYETGRMRDYILDYMAYRMLLNGGDKLADELLAMRDHMAVVETEIMNDTMWVDHDQDQIIDDGEEQKSLPSMTSRGY